MIMFFKITRLVDINVHTGFTKVFWSDQFADLSQPTFFLAIAISTLWVCQKSDFSVPQLNTINPIIQLQIPHIYSIKSP